MVILWRRELTQQERFVRKADEDKRERSPKLFELEFCRVKLGPNRNLECTILSSLRLHEGIYFTGVTREAEVGTQVLAVARLPKAYFTSNRFQVTVALTPVIPVHLRTVMTLVVGDCDDF